MKIFRRVWSFYDAPGELLTGGGQVFLMLISPSLLVVMISALFMQASNYLEPCQRDYNDC